VHQEFVSGQCLAVLYYNNLGCVHLQMKKYNVATFYFTKALQANQKHLLEDSKRKGGGTVASVLADRRHEILYNQGLVLLLLRRFVAAHEVGRRSAPRVGAHLAMSPARGPRWRDASFPACLPCCNLHPPGPRLSACGRHSA